MKGDAIVTEYDLALLPYRMNCYVRTLIRNDLTQRSGVYRQYDENEVRALAAFLEDTSSLRMTDVTETSPAAA